MASAKKPGLYANIHAKQERIAHGSGETMRKPGSEGAPSEKSFATSAKTTKSVLAAKRSAAAKKGARTAGKHASATKTKTAAERTSATKAQAKKAAR